VRRVAALTLAAAVLAGCGSGKQLPVAPPSSGPAEIGIPYSVVTNCMLPFKLGDKWWVFEVGVIAPHPGPQTGSYAIPGVVTLSTPSVADFRADSNGAHFRVSASDTNPEAGFGCL
jgi:hypothetical protein